ncbi:hypothetical protein Tco_1310768 [Tanacetum coccineum]
MAYPCLHSSKTTRKEDQYAVSRRSQYAVLKILKRLELIVVTKQTHARIEPLEFISQVNSSFDKHMKLNERTKKVLFHAWINGNWNKRRIDDSILRSNNTTTDSFFKPYLITHRKSDTEKEDEQSQTKCKYSNTTNSVDEQ